MGIFFFSNREFTRNHFAVQRKWWEGIFFFTLSPVICIKYKWEGTHNLLKEEATFRVKCLLISQTADQIS